LSLEVDVRKTNQLITAFSALTLLVGHVLEHPECKQVGLHLLTSMDCATLLHVKSTILHYPPSIITRQRASV